VYGPADIVRNILNTDAAKQRLRSTLTAMGFDGIEFSCHTDDESNQNKSAELDIRVHGDRGIPEEVLNQWCDDMQTVRQAA